MSCPIRTPSSMTLRRAYIPTSLKQNSRVILIQKYSTRCFLRRDLCSHKNHNLRKYTPIKMRFKNSLSKLALKIIYERDGCSRRTNFTSIPTYPRCFPSVERKPEHNYRDSEIHPSSDLFCRSRFQYPSTRANIHSAGRATAHAPTTSRSVCNTKKMHLMIMIRVWIDGWMEVYRLHRFIGR